MPAVKHPHSYLASHSLEFLDSSALRDFWESTPSHPTHGQLLARSQVETELALHPQLSRQEHKKYARLRNESDEEIMANGYNISEVSTCLGHVFLPVVLGVGHTRTERWRETHARARKLLRACENGMTKESKYSLALGVAAELLFDLGIHSDKVVAIPSLTREDKHSSLDGKKYCWDALVQARGRQLPHGNYRVQVKYRGDQTAHPPKVYHPDIVMIRANPDDAFHVANNAFVDFVRLALPDTPASHEELDRYRGRIQTFQTALREHGPSQLHKVTDHCLVPA